jgi:hypothetical protein
MPFHSASKSIGVRSARPAWPREGPRANAVAADKGKMTKQLATG